MKLNKRGLILINKMMSTKSFLIKTLPLVLIVFSISLVPTAFGLSAYSDPLVFEMEKGETQMLEWGIVNLAENPINIEFYTEGPGSELLVFENFATIPKATVYQLEIFVQIPKDHKDNIEFRPTVFALQRGDSGDDSSSGMVFNVKVESHPIIKIGENPIYTEPKKQITNELPPAPEPEVFEEVEEIDPQIALAEKMAQIQEANQPKEVKVDDTFEESFEEEAVTDYEPEPEYIMEPKDIVIPTEKTIVEEKIECDFFAMILSWFGMGKC